MRILTTLLLFLGLSVSHVAQSLQEPLEAELEILEEADRLVVSAIFQNNTQAFLDYEYRLRVERSGPNGSLSSGQRNDFRAGPDQRVVLASTDLNRDPADTYVLRLEILDAKGQVILTDEVIIDGKKKTRTRTRSS